jgi:hypothetical protein
MVVATVVMFNILKLIMEIMPNSLQHYIPNIPRGINKEQMLLSFKKHHKTQTVLNLSNPFSSNYL